MRPPPCACIALISLAQVVAIVLIAVAAVARDEAVIATVAILGGVLAVGVLLMMLSLLGAFAVWKQKRVLVFIVCSPADATHARLYSHALHVCSTWSDYSCCL